MTSKINMNQQTLKDYSETGNLEMNNKTDRKQPTTISAQSGFKLLKRRARLGENERKEPTKIPT